MKLLIAIPCGDSLDVNFVDSLIHLKTPDNTQIRFGAGSLVYDARNQLAHQAVEGGFDYILWLDSDMSFEPDLFERLYAHDKDFVTGLYFSRRSPFRPTIYQKCDYVQKDDGSYDIEWEQVHPIPDELFEIKACGFGAVLMKTSIAETVFHKGGLPFSPMLGLGEDLSFCIRARECCDTKLYCDPTIILGHTAHVVIGDESFRQSWNSSRK